MSETTALGWRAWGAWLAVPLISGAAFVAVYVAGVLTARGQALEDLALAGATPARQLPFVLSLVTVPILLLALVVLLGIAAARRRWDRMLQAALVVGISNLATQTLKYVVLGRPPLGGPSDENSFPSGHTTAYVSVFMALVIVVPAGWAWGAALVGTVLSSWAALELLGYGYHRLSDVLGAIALVLTVLSASLVLTSWLRPHQVRVRPRHPIASVAPTLAAGVVIAAAVAFGAVMSWPISRDRFLLIGTEVATAAAVSLAFSVAVGLAQRLGDVTTPVRDQLRTR